MVSQNKTNVRFYHNTTGGKPFRKGGFIMTPVLGLIIFCELLLTLGIVYGMLHEQALIRFERALAARIRAAIREKRQLRAKRAREKYNARVTYVPVRPRAKSAGDSRSAA